MSAMKKLQVLALTGIVALCALEIGERLAIPGVSGIVAEARAEIGRPLTPLSIAGAARRTVRRCAAGVYNC